MPQLQGKDGFDVLRYENALRYAGKTTAQFEESMKKGILLQNISNVFQQSSKLSQKEEDFQKSLKNTYLNIAYLKFKKDELSDKKQEAERVLENIQKWTESRNEKVLLKALKKKDWLKTGEFSLINSSSSALGKNPSFIHELLKTKTVGKMLDRTMFSPPDESYYILKLLSVKEKKSKEKVSEQSRSYILFENYMASLRQKATIKKNPRF